MSLNREENNVTRKTTKLTNEQINEISEAFEEVDTDKDNVISLTQLKVAMQHLNFDINDADAAKIISDNDKECTGKIHYNDFMEVMTCMVLERNPVVEMQRAFRLFDRDGSGTINIRDLRKVVKEVGVNMTEEQLRSMIDEFDNNRDGEIDEKEFVSFLTGHVSAQFDDVDGDLTKFDMVGSGTLDTKHFGNKKFS